MKKPKWKRRIKYKVQNKTQEKLEKEMKNKTKLRSVRENKWERKKYIATCDNDLVKGTKFRLHICELKKNYPIEEEDMKCPTCNETEDTIEYQTVETVYRIINNTHWGWAEKVKLYKQNK